MAAERAFTELIPNYKEMHRIIYAHGCTGYFTPIRYMTNCIYGYWIIRRGGGQTYSLSTQYSNKIGLMTFNDQGILAKVLSSA